MRFLVLALLACLGAHGVWGQTPSGWAVIDAHKQVPLVVSLTLEIPGQLNPVTTERLAMHPFPTEARGEVHAVVLEPQYMLHSEVVRLPYLGVDTIRMEPLRPGSSTSLPRVRFLEDSFRLDYHSLPTLEHLKAFLEMHPTIELNLEGVSQEHDAVACERRGRQRARSVWEYLVTEGIDPTRLNLQGRCEQDPNAHVIAVEVRSM